MGGPDDLFPPDLEFVGSGKRETRVAALCQGQMIRGPPGKIGIQPDGVERMGQYFRNEHVGPVKIVVLIEDILGRDNGIGDLIVVEDGFPAGDTANIGAFVILDKFGIYGPGYLLRNAERE